MWLVFLLFVLSEPNHLHMCSNPVSVFLLARVQTRSRRAFSALFVRWRAFFILFWKSSTCVVFMSAMYTKTISRIRLRLFPPISVSSGSNKWKIRLAASQGRFYVFPRFLDALFMNPDSDTFHGCFVPRFSLVIIERCLVDISRNRKGLGRKPNS